MHHHHPAHFWLLKDYVGVCYACHSACVENCWNQISFYHVGPRDGILFVELGSNHLYPLSPLTGSSDWFFVLLLMLFGFVFSRQSFFVALVSWNSESCPFLSPPGTRIKGVRHHARMAYLGVSIMDAVETSGSLPTHLFETVFCRLTQDGPLASASKYWG